MIAIDTNIVVRYLTGDHPEQSASARDLIDRHYVFVPITVILEVEWVLRSAYRFSSTEVISALRAFGGLATVAIERADIVAEALDRTAAGMDFADALHLGGSAHCEKMATFDRRFVEAAGAARTGFVEEV